jgi:hypothetical protein
VIYYLVTGDSGAQIVADSLMLKDTSALIQAEADSILVSMAALGYPDQGQRFARFASHSTGAAVACHVVRLQQMPPALARPMTSNRLANRCSGRHAPLASLERTPKASA